MIELRRARRPSADVELTPLIDVVFQLLVFFLLTSAFITHAIPLDLPGAATGEQTVTTLAITIDRAGHVFLDTNPVTDQALRERVRAARESDDGVRAVISADGRIVHAKVVQVMDLLRQEGVTKFAINVDPEVLDDPGPRHHDPGHHRPSGG